MAVAAVVVVEVAAAAVGVEVEAGVGVAGVVGVVVGVVGEASPRQNRFDDALRTWTETSRAGRALPGFGSVADSAEQAPGSKGLLGWFRVGPFPVLL